MSTHDRRRDVGPLPDAEWMNYHAAVVNDVSDAVIDTSLDGIVTRWSRRAETIYRRPAEDAIGLLISDAVGAPLSPASVVAAGGVDHATHHAADGAALAMRVRATDLGDRYLLVCADQTAARHAEQRMDSVLRNLREAIVIIDADDRFESANPEAERILGFTSAALIGMPHSADAISLVGVDGLILVGDQHPIVGVRHRTGGLRDVVVGLDRADGQRQWLSGSCAPLTPEDPEHSALIVSFTDITDRHVEMQRLEHQAAHDPMTGLANRSEAIARASDALDHGSARRLAAVLFIDLDNLKPINDSLGHQAGDVLVQTVAHRLKRSVRPLDVVARYGGDEFVLLLDPTGRGEVDELAARIHAALCEAVVIDGATIQPGASIGITIVEDDDPRSAAEILHAADKAMYEAKSAGRGLIHYLSDA